MVPGVGTVALVTVRVETVVVPTRKPLLVVLFSGALVQVMEDSSQTSDESGRKRRDAV